LLGNHLLHLLASLAWLNGLILLFEIIIGELMGNKLFLKFYLTGTLAICTICILLIELLGLGYWEVFLL
jgi:hypothetical protein